MQKKPKVISVCRPVTSYREAVFEGRSHLPDETGSEIWRVNWRDFGFNFCGVYLIAQKTGWPVKVGISEFAPKRLAQLQTSHWAKLVIGRYWICENRAAARLIEASAHELLQKEGAHLHGEWFDTHLQKAAEIVVFAAMRDGISLVSEVPEAAKFAPVHEFLRKCQLAFEENEGRRAARAG